MAPSRHLTVVAAPVLHSHPSVSLPSLPQVRFRLRYPDSASMALEPFRFFLSLSFASARTEYETDVFLPSVHWTAVTLQRSLLPTDVRFGARDAKRRLKSLTECVKFLSRYEHGRRLVNEVLLGATEDTTQRIRTMRERHDV